MMASGFVITPSSAILALYMFSPALPWGGAEEIAYVNDSGMATVHLDILFQMGAADSRPW